MWNDLKLSKIVPGLTSNKIVSSLRPVKKSLDLHWRDLARELGTDGALVNKLNRDCLLGLRGELDIVQELIDNWKMRNANQATLGILITHFDAAELSDAAEILVTLQNGLLR